MPVALAVGDCEGDFVLLLEYDNDDDRLVLDVADNETDGVGVEEGDAEGVDCHPTTCRPYRAREPGNTE